jgi:hypothetical protein
MVVGSIYLAAGWRRSGAKKEIRGAVRVRVIDRQTNGYDQVRPKMRKGRGREWPGTEAR